MNIIPIFCRELIAAARQSRLRSARTWFAVELSLMVVGAFAAWYYWAGGVLDSQTMARIANECLRWGVVFHVGIAGVVMMWGARSIAKERDSRTLDFVLVTRLTSADIVLAKLASCLVSSLMVMASGLPIMLLLHVLGGIDLRVILLAYAGFASGMLLLSSMSMWISAEVPDVVAASAFFIIGTMAWMIGPFSLTVFLPRFGIRLPDWLAAANWWLVSSSPLSVAFRIATGLNSWPQLVDLVGRMIGLQLMWTALFTVAAIVRLRPAHRAIAGIDRQARRRERRRLSWRLRPRPPVGDDPIYWREKYTSRRNILLNAMALLIFGGLLVGLAGATFYYARPAFVEVWRNGYASAATAAPEREMNILMRLFLGRAGAGGPVDMARGDFNLFIRYATVTIMFMMVFLIGGMAGEVVGIERMKGTWSGVLATPMTAADVLRSALRATAWRTRWAFGAVIVLWTLGLAAGAIHPLGFLVSMLELAASAWMMAVLGVLGSIRAEKAENAVGQGLLLTMALTSTGVLPMLWRAGLNSVLWGATSVPLMLWTSLVSYRELAAVLGSPLDPHFQWVGLIGGQMPLLVFTSWTIAIIGPALGGLWAWRYTVTHFDRLVGRPHRTPEPAGVTARPGHHAAILPNRRSPLAEADGAV